MPRLPFCYKRSPIGPAKCPTTKGCSGGDFVDSALGYELTRSQLSVHDIITLLCLPLSSLSYVNLQKGILYVTGLWAEVLAVQTVEHHFFIEGAAIKHPRPSSLFLGKVGFEPSGLR